MKYKNKEKPSWRNIKELCKGHGRNFTQIVKAKTLAGSPELAKMTLYLDNHILLMVFLIFIAAFVASCGSTPKMLYQTQRVEKGLRFYFARNPRNSNGKGPFYAHVDSNRVKIHYSFQLDNIYKTYRKNDNYVYTLVFDKQTRLQLTFMDSIVLAKADHLMDSLGFKTLKRVRGATGFVVEIARH